MHSKVMIVTGELFGQKFAHNSQEKYEKLLS